MRGSAPYTGRGLGSAKLLSNWRGFQTPPPETFSELVDDKVIAAVYEDQNDGSYKDALRKAAKPFGEGSKAWRKIMRAMDAAYAVNYFGLEFAPKPRVHFLHRNLLTLVDSPHLRDLTLRGVVEFIDDLCPCGKRHNLDAIRKLKRRAARRAGVAAGNDPVRRKRG